MPRKCTICGHKSRSAIDKALVARQPFRAIARQFKVSKDALIRHHDDHLPEASAMIEELQNFKIKFTRAGNETYEAWRESDHDDLVLAAAMAAWFGEKKLQSILTLPPLPPAPVEMRQPTLNELIDMQPKQDSDDILRL